LHGHSFPFTYLDLASAGSATVAFYDLFEAFVDIFPGQPVYINSGTTTGTPTHSSVPPYSPYVGAPNIIQLSMAWANS
jgi:hypothetical protein